MPMPISILLLVFLLFLLDMDFHSSNHWYLAPWKYTSTSHSSTSADQLTTGTTAIEERQNAYPSTQIFATSHQHQACRRKATWDLLTRSSPLPIRRFIRPPYPSLVIFMPPCDKGNHFLYEGETQQRVQWEDEKLRQTIGNICLRASSCIHGWRAMWLPFG